MCKLPTLKSIHFLPSQKSELKQNQNRERAPSNLFFRHNTSLGPPYRVLLDTNFINFSIKNKLEIVKAMMDCLFAKCEWSSLRNEFF
jgi:U3 small nucleolar RNA-associated protein 24